MPSGSQEPPPAPGGSPRCKYRVRFEKAGELRLVSHHDLMHCLQRMFRRAALPVHVTQGFNPRPRLVFAQSLALGVVGRNEVFELELVEALAADELHRRLAAQCPPGLAILAVKPIDARTSARARRAGYRLPLQAPVADLSDRCAAFLAREHHWIERTRPHHRRLDLRPFVGSLAARDHALEMMLWISPYGAARPEEVVEALGLRDLLERGAVLERTDLELADETIDTTPPPAGLPAAPAAPAAEQPTPENAEGGDSPEDRPPAPRPAAIVTGPLSFDS